MSALLPSPLSGPAERVQVPTDCSTQRFSRSLDERAPHVRSSTAVIVPMGADEPMHPADLFVIRWSMRALVALAVIFAAQWFFPEWFLP